ncbi:MAG: type II secretion system protein [Bacteroidia bacterium]
MKKSFDCRKNISKPLKAFTLTELLVVLIIVGILVLLALPNLMPLISKTKSTEAQLQLEHLHNLEKSYFYLHSKYTTDLNELGFIQEDMVSENGQGRANYKIEVSTATQNSFIATATSVTDFDGDGVYNVWQIDHNKNLTESTKD